MESEHEDPEKPGRTVMDLTSVDVRQKGSLKDLNVGMAQRRQYCLSHGKIGRPGHLGL